MVLILTSCSAGAGSETGGSYAEPAVEAPGVSGSSEDYSSTEQSTKDGIVAPAEVEVEDRSLIVTGNLSLINENPTETVNKIRAEVTGVGGRVDELSETPGNEYENASAYLTVRIPSEKLETTVERVKTFGVVESYSVQSSDVTDQLTDYEVREKVLRGSIDRLLDMLSKATDTNTLINIENTLSQREAELESLLAAKTSLTDKVEFSTLAITIQQPDDVDSPEPTGFWDGLVSGWNSLIATLAGLLVAFGFLLPWTIVLAIIAVITTFVVKLHKRRKKSKGVPEQNLEEPLAPEESKQTE